MKISIAIGLILLIFLMLPFSIVPVVAVIIYVYWYKDRDFMCVVNWIERINQVKLVIACGLTLASLLIIYQQTAYATKFGYPSPIVTYYSYPATPGVTVIVGPLWSRLAIDLFAASLDVVSYYLLLSLLQWIYRRGILWLGGNDAVTG